MPLPTIRNISVLALLYLALFGWGCGSPAASPGPPSELPSALVIPSTVGINADKVGSQSSETGGLVATDGAYSNRIASGADSANAVNEILDEILVLFKEMEIPVGEDEKTFETTLKKTFEGKSLTLAVKIDFADYDLDDNEKSEGCSGHTAATPVCMRLWVNGERLLAAVFDEFPTKTNAGAGRFRMGTNKTDGEVAGTDFELGIVYDHQDDEKKTTELFAIGETTENEDVLSGNFRGHIALTQTGPVKTAKTTIKNISLFLGSGAMLNFGGYYYVAQWLEDEDFWSGTFEETTSTGIAVSEIEEHVCARISTGDQVERDECQDRDIDVDGIDDEDFDFPIFSDVGFSSDFPEGPTF